MVIWMCRIRELCLFLCFISLFQVLCKSKVLSGFWITWWCSSGLQLGMAQWTLLRMSPAVESFGISHLPVVSWVTFDGVCDQLILAVGNVWVFLAVVWTSCCTCSQVSPNMICVLLCGDNSCGAVVLAHRLWACIGCVAPQRWRRSFERRLRGTARQWLSLKAGTQILMW